MMNSQPPDVSVSGSGKPRVLLVDDDRTLSAAIRFTLEGAGFMVFAADDARAALAIASQNGDFDLVVTDLMMPDMNGTELIEALRIRARDLTAIIISGYPPHLVRTQFQIPANTVFLEKTAAARMLVPTIRTLLGEPLRPHLAPRNETVNEVRPLA
jgi:two-component system cell cycle sensor histidine kinase/response regulator CckA